ncbi:hypothetical protein [Niabella hibiscisoli]|uniref:hypothetical protein n=1 Tax=Niabella hibiscisoli TaxID=1825928 RepID=UPI001F0D5C46|nr:hypothetical protein [Niabella hibiscisoli]MCH5716364.1 hypothetical protein [Niabella hibiscisoli]
MEPHATGISEWEPEKRDSIVMDRLMKNGLQLYTAAKTDLFKLKYAYQVIRLAHYNNRSNDAIKYYDEMVSANTTQSVLQPMSLALKAGALFRTGKNHEAAYLFSKAFHQGQAKKISNYYGFDWAVVRTDNLKQYLSFCKNDGEKADMLSLFALRNPDNGLAFLKQVYQLKPSSDLLPTLVVREINKYEERYLTPLIGKEYNSGLLGISYYYQYTGKETDSLLRKEKPELGAFVEFVNNISKDAKVKDPALMQLSAAYGAYVLRDYKKANSLLAPLKTANLNARLQDQWMLTNLLVQISSQDKIDAAFEEKILPSLRWLYSKCFKNEKEKGEENVYYYGNEEKGQSYKFYRNVLVDILSKRYKAQGNLDKALLAIGSPESLMPEYYDQSTEFLRSQLNGQQAEALYHFLAAKKFTPFEQFLVTNNRLKIKTVADFAGTAYLRDHNYDKAIEWLQKVPGQNKVIEKDPFKELLYDQEERLPGDKVTTNKLAYAREMKRLQGLVKTDAANAAQHLYKLALGYYNITYYGYAWNLVEYWRSGADGYYVPKNATDFQKDYYCATTAEAYFKKAMEASTNQEFKAKCLFMMAKCSQKQLPKPQYSDFGNYDEYRQKADKYEVEFTHNRYYPQLKAQFGNTKFYKDALTRCSYLSDFAAK